MNPQYPENMRLVNWAQSPTAPTSVSPRRPSMMVSTMLPVVDSRFCSATGIAMAMTMERSFRNVVFVCMIKVPP